jgi:hypothetical protein
MEISGEAIGSAPQGGPAAADDAPRPAGAVAGVKEAVAAAQNKSNLPVDDDPEIEMEIEEGRKEKMRRSQIGARFKRAREIEGQATRRLAEIQKAYEERVRPIEEYSQRLKQNPLALFEIARSMGLDPDDVARQYAQEYVKRQDMTPEQRRIFQLEQELQQRDGSMRQQQEAQQKIQQEQEQVALKQEIEQEIVAAAAKNGIPKHPMALALLNSFAAAQVRAGFERPDFNMAAEQVHEYAKGYIGDWVKGMDYGTLVKTMPDLVKMIREGDMKAASGGQVPQKPRTTRKAEQQEFINPEDWRRGYVAGLK